MGALIRCDVKSAPSPLKQHPLRSDSGRGLQPTAGTSPVKAILHPRATRLSETVLHCTCTPITPVPSYGFRVSGHCAYTTCVRTLAGLAGSPLPFVATKGRRVHRTALLRVVRRH